MSFDNIVKDDYGQEVKITFNDVDTGAAADHEVDVPPAGSHTAIFVLEATQPGTAQIHANVTVDTREESPSTRPVSSEYVVEVSVAQ